MPDDRRRIDPSTPDPGPTLAQALSGLPLAAPERSAWPLLAARLARRRRLHLRGMMAPLALAAALAMIAVLLRPLLPTPNSEATAPTVEDPALAVLMTESARLETLLGSQPEPAAVPAPLAAMSLDLEERLQAVDALLADPDLGERRKLPLWQARVALLHDLADVQGTRHWLADRGDRFDAALVVAY